MEKKNSDLVYICADVFDDYALKNFINSNSESDSCDWTNKKKPSISLETLGDFIEECLNQEYGDPYNLGAGYDKEATYYEDSFPGIEVHGILDLLQDHHLVTPFKVIEKIREFIDNEYWAPTYLYGLSRHDFLLESWSKFTEIIKHKVRFMFFDKEISKIEPSYDEYSNPYQILYEIGTSIEELGLLSRFEAKELTIYRARQHSKSEKIVSVAQIGPPPDNKSQANRMSPAGISMFYGALDNTTAVTEIIDIGRSSEIITTGQFENLKELTLIDFSKLEYISIFDKERVYMRDSYFFLRDFVQDLSSPISHDGSHHIEYVPTQVVTEYFKNAFMSNHDIEVHGMIYPSAKKTSGKYLVLFFNQTNVTDGINSTDNFLGLKKTSLNDVKVSDIKIDISLPS